MAQSVIRLATPDDRELARAALGASASAYAPYSGFAVGAAVRARDGRVFLGANLENASYGVTMCAEVAAITAANTAGGFDFEAIAIVGHKFTEPTSATVPVSPCGRCRQLIAESAQLSGIDVRVLSCSGDLATVHVAPISELLPDAFGPRSMGIHNSWPGIKAHLSRATAMLAAGEKAGAPPAPRVAPARRRRQA